MKKLRNLSKIGVIGCLVNGVWGVDQGMCMMAYEDRLDCVLDPLISRSECMKRDCCYDSNVPDGIPHCYFALELDKTDILEAELAAKPLVTATGSYQRQEVPDLPTAAQYHQLINSILNDPEEKEQIMTQVQLETCDLSAVEMNRCGRRGVPKRRCVELGCCWNQKWRPGGLFGPRCHKAEIKDEEHNYPNGKMTKSETSATSRKLPIKPEKDETHTDMQFMKQNLDSKVEKLKAEGCKPNHNQIQCIQGVMERLKCDISDELSLGIPACTACINKGCCFDPEPKIIAGMIYPICFEHGPISISDLPEIEPTEEIPEVSDEDFNKMLSILEGGEENIESVKEPLEFQPIRLGPMTDEELERKRRRERYEEFMEMNIIHESSKIEIGAIIPPSGSGGIVKFPGHPTFDRDFEKQRKEITTLENTLKHQLAEREEARATAIRQMMSQMDPSLAQYISEDGTLDLTSFSPASPEWQSGDRQAASNALFETIKNSQQENRDGEVFKYGSPELAPSPTSNLVVETVKPTTTTTREFFTTKTVVTRPTIQTTIDSYKRQLVEQQMQTEEIRLIRAGVREPALSQQLVQKRATLEQRFGLVKTTKSATTTSTTFLNKYEELKLRLDNKRQMLAAQGYSGAALELELQKFRRQTEASLGINTPVTTTTQPTTTTTTQPPKTTTLPFFPESDESDKTCFPSQCGVPSQFNPGLKKIVGGQVTGNIKYWPWQASLRRSFTDDPSFYHLCGATLISESWVLTAAHCFIRYTKKMKIDVRMMEKDISRYLMNFGRYTKNQFEYNMQPRALSYFFAHPEFHPWIGNQMHDIAVAKLHRPIAVTDYVKPVCLPDIVPPVRADIYITGWGSTKNVGPSGNQLKELKLPLATQSECERQWKGYFNDGWICTDPGFLEDACQGDSGGPAVYYDPHFTKRFSIVGVTIAGSETCSTSRATVKAGVYSNVLYYMDFINHATGKGCR